MRTDRRARWRMAAVVLWLVSLGSGSADARETGPLEALKDQIGRTVTLLTDPALQGDAHLAERRAAVRRIANEIFDFEEMARRSLGQHWRERTPAERKRFIELFSDLLERAYFWRLDAYTGESVRYVSETVEGDRATVQTVIVTRQGSNVPVDYRMLRRNGDWLVYDVLIEGVSLIANYRSQFNKVIRTESYEDLVKRMESKVLERPES